MKLTQDMFTLPLTDAVRDFIRERLARSLANVMAEDRGYRYDVAMNGTPGVATMSDEDLLSDALDTFEDDDFPLDTDEDS